MAHGAVSFKKRTHDGLLTECKKQTPCHGNHIINTGVFIQHVMHGDFHCLIIGNLPKTFLIFLVPAPRSLVGWSECGELQHSYCLDDKTTHHRSWKAAFPTSWQFANDCQNNWLASVTKSFAIFRIYLHTKNMKYPINTGVSSHRSQKIQT